MPYMPACLPFSLEKQKAVLYVFNGLILTVVTLPYQHGKAESVSQNSFWLLLEEITTS